jgi:hypothetical protein
MRLYRAICAWLEASAEAMSEAEDFGPEGAGEARSEHAHSFSAPPELHIRSDRQSLDDDDSGSYRKRRPIGFTRNGA